MNNLVVVHRDIQEFSHRIMEPFELEKELCDLQIQLSTWQPTKSYHQIMSFSATGVLDLEPCAYVCTILW